MSMESLQNIGFGGAAEDTALPKVLAELQGLKMSLVTGATAGTAMDVAGMEPEDTIVAAINLTDDAAVDVGNITIVDRRATADITCLATAAAGDFVTVHGKKYTVRDQVETITYNRPPYDVPVDITPSGNDAEALATSLSKAIMSGDSALTTEIVDDTSSPPLKAVVRVHVRTPGTAGNAYTLTETGSAFTVGSFAGGLATSGEGFKSSDNLSGKKVLVLWFDKQQ